MHSKLKAEFSRNILLDVSNQTTIQDPSGMYLLFYGNIPLRNSNCPLAGGSCLTHYLRVLRGATEPMADISVL